MSFILYTSLIIFFAWLGLSIFEALLYGLPVLTLKRSKLIHHGWADIGIICYDFSDLNHIYCASNKLYEYSGFSIPILCSENPGIKFPVEINNIGVSTNFNQPNDILSVLNSLIADFNILKANSTFFYKNSNYDISKKLRLNG